MSHVEKEDNVSASLPADATTDNKEQDKDNGKDGDEEYISDEYDMDDSEKGNETGKKNTLLTDFFETLHDMNIDEINEEDREWPCPVCNNGNGGPGAIFWYKGLQPLINHAKTRGKIRVMVHREFAQLLEEGLRTRGTSVIPYGEAFDEWRGLNENVVRVRR